MLNIEIDDEYAPQKMEEEITINDYDEYMNIEKEEFNGEEEEEEEMIEITQEELEKMEKEEKYII